MQPPRSSNSTRFIVCEKSGDWAKRLRRMLPCNGRWLAETRSFGQLLASAEEYSTSFALVEVTNSDMESAATHISELQRRFPKCRIAVALSSEGQHWHHRNMSGLFRELGVVSVVQSPRELNELSNLWAAHCKTHPPQEQTLRQRIFEQLPWASASSAVANRNTR